MSMKNSGRMRHAFMAPDVLAKVTFACILPLMAVTACSSDSHSDLSAYVAEVEARKAGRITTLPEIKGYESYAYNKRDLRDPFKASIEESLADVTADDGLQPDIQRNKEPLEMFPLDSLRFVGHLEQEGRVWAVITAPDTMVYRVEEGNYVGQSFGRIVLINETQIDVKEIVPSGLGGWTERDATLMLAE